MNIIMNILVVALGVTGLHGIISSLFFQKKESVYTRNSTFLGGTVFLIFSFVAYAMR